MPNEIPSRQNDADMLKLLYAYHQAYKDSGRHSLCRTSLIIASAVALPVIGEYFPSLRAYGAVISILIFVADLAILEPQIRKHRLIGARIQELFDVTLFQLPWPDHVAGDAPLPEDVDQLARKYSASNSPERLAMLLNWYPVEVQSLPLPTARIVCQRSNCVWDSKLRNYYCQVLFGLLAIIITTSIFVATGMNWTLSQFLLSAAIPLLPSIRAVWRETFNHKEAAAFSIRTRRALEAVWSERASLQYSPDLLAVHARYIQTYLYDRRVTTSRIPEWFYKYFRERLELEMRQAVRDMIKES